MEFKLKYNGSELDITQFVSTIEGGISTYPITSYERLGDGVILSKNNNFGGKVFKLTASFSTTTAANRETFLSWMTLGRNEEILLEKTDDNGYTGEVRVFPVLVSGETYSKLLKRYTSEYELYTENAFFEKTTITEHTGLVTGGSVAVTNSGLRVFAYYTFTITTAATYLKLYTADGYGFQITTQLSVSDVVVIDTRSNDLLVTINGGIVRGITSTGSRPFFLKYGSNTIYTECDGAASWKVSYYETRM